MKATRPAIPPEAARAMLDAFGAMPSAPRGADSMIGQWAAQAACLTPWYHTPSLAQHVGLANSARFKYLLGKQAGIKPALAQKLIVKPVPNSALLEASVGVLSKEEGRRYSDAFVQTLQALCGNQAQLALADQSIR